VQDKLRQAEPASVLLAFCIGKKLVERVDAEGLRAGAAKGFFRRQKGVGLVLRGDGALVAMTEWVVERMTGRIEANVVHCPAIDGNGGNTLRRLGRGFAQSFLDAVEDAVEWPVERGAARHRAVGDAMDFGDFGTIIDPAKEGNTAAFSAEVDGDTGAKITGNWACHVPRSRKRDLGHPM
jgi:hypothetical protein